MTYRRNINKNYNPKEKMKMGKFGANREKKSTAWKILKKLISNNHNVNKF